MPSKTAMITGISGQDGSYLAELLLAKGYQVHGLIRRSSSFNTRRIDHLYQHPQSEKRKLILHYADLSDGSRLSSLLADIQPDEIYNLAAQSHVRVSFDEPEYTSDITALGTVRLLEAVMQSCPSSRFYQAGSSEMFGGANPPQSEATPFYPKSPYGVAKLYSHWLTTNYRESYGLFAANGILFNHESPRRGETFVTRKISKGVAEIIQGKREEIYLGNLDAVRDWGYAPEYVVAMWRMLQEDSPGDFVISTGKPSSVKDFVGFCFEYAGLDPSDHVRFDDRYLRPSEVDYLLGDSSKAKESLSLPELTSAEELAKIMVDQDLKMLGDATLIDSPASELWLEETRS